MMAVTLTLYRYIQSELIKRGFNEIVDSSGNLVFFEQESQLMTKILSYDTDVQDIITSLFGQETLTDPVHDDHFKKTFFYRFINRQINRQTVEAFRLELLATFLVNRRYIDMMYRDAEKMIQGITENTQDNHQTNSQSSSDESVMDNRSAFSNLPQNRVNLDVDNTTMTSANDNTVTRSRTANDGSSHQATTGNSSSETRSYRLEELFKSTGMESRLFDEFDRKCFLQVW